MLPTLRNVADRAGVSVSTVSRVIRGERYISDATRKRVLDTIAELGYQPDLDARRLKSGRTFVIGFVVPDISNPFFSHLVKAAERVIHELGQSKYELIVCNTDGRPERERAAIDLLLGRRAEGMLLASTGDPATVARVRALVESRNLPVVLIDNDLPGVQADLVTVDNRAAARALMEHLLGHGHRRLGIIAGPLHESSAAERLAGCHDGLVAAGVDPTAALVAAGDWGLESGRRITEEWLGLAEPPTAIFSSNNFMTVGALMAIRDRGLRIPRDIALVSFDEVEFGFLLSPAWTTIDYSLDETGAGAARLVLERINGQENMPPRQLRIPHRLLVRESCGCIG